VAIVLTRTPYALKPYGSDNYSDPVGSFRTLAKDRLFSHAGCARSLRLRG